LCWGEGVEVGGEPGEPGVGGQGWTMGPVAGSVAWLGS
jgi:hypothetical protein